jgi:hypothetical protein
MSKTTNIATAAQPRIAWGVPAIARAIGRKPKAVYHSLETGALPGAAKIGGTWALDLDRFFATFGKTEAA